MDLTDPKYVDANPLVAAELVKSMSAHELVQLYQRAQPDEPFGLDNEAVKQAILSSGDTGKLLALCLFGCGGFMRGLTQEEILKLADVSKAHRAALFSNTRIGWYSVDLLCQEKLVRTRLLEAAADADDGSFGVLLRNPRMDREFVAEVISGKGRFADWPVERRWFCALEAVKPKEIKEPYYKGQDAPSNNELYFDRPIEAFFKILRELVEQAATKSELRKIITYGFPGVSSILETEFGIGVDDWLTREDKALIDDERGRVPEPLASWHLQFSRKRELAIERFVEWATVAGKGEPLTSQSTEEFEIAREFVLGTILQAVAYMALRKWDTLYPRDALIQKLMVGESWVGRAAAIGTKFDRLSEQSLQDAAVSDFLSVCHSNCNAALRGVALSRRFWELADQTDKENLAQRVKEVVKSAEADKGIETYVNEVLADHFVKAVAEDLHVKPPDNPEDLFLPEYEGKFLEEKIDYFGKVLLGLKKPSLLSQWEQALERLFRTVQSTLAFWFWFIGIVTVVLVFKTFGSWETLLVLIASAAVALFMSHKSQ